MDLNLGKHCALADCRQLDFLPYKCDACGKVTCHEHRQYAAHGCTEAYRKDVIVPACPLCGVIVESRPGVDPNVAMNDHIAAGCVSPRSGRKIYPNSCNFKGCKTREAMQLMCSDCHLNYCLRHRFQSDHQCNPKAAASAAAAAAQQRSGSKASSKAPSSVASSSASAATSAKTSTSNLQPSRAAPSAAAAAAASARIEQIAADARIARSLQQGGTVSAAPSGRPETEEEQIQRAIAESLRLQQQQQQQQQQQGDAKVNPLLRVQA